MKHSSIVIKELSGFSGSKVLMMQCEDHFFIRKIDNIERNFVKMNTLKELGFLVPDIICKENNKLDMEYISGIDMKTFLTIKNTERLLNFIIKTINQFKNIYSGYKDYTRTYVDQLSWLDSDISLPFTVEELIAKLPKTLPVSLCHGDFSLDNIIYKEPDFYMIDPSTGVYDSWIFDIAKLRQDLDGKWFVRNDMKCDLGIELAYIKSVLTQNFPEAFDDYLYILMLLRVYKYSQQRPEERMFLLKEIKRIWK